MGIKSHYHREGRDLCYVRDGMLLIHGFIRWLRRPDSSKKKKKKKDHLETSYQTCGTSTTLFIGCLLMIDLIANLISCVLKFLSNLLQQRMHVITSSTTTQLFLTEDY